MKLARLQTLQAKIDAQAQAISRGMVGTRQRVLVEGRAQEGRRRARGPHRQQPRRQFRRPARLVGQFVDVTITAALPHSLRGEIAARSRLKPVEISFTPVDNQRLANLCGALDENLRQIETALDVTIARRGERFAIDRQARAGAARGEAAASASTTRRAKRI